MTELKHLYKRKTLIENMAKQIINTIQYNSNIRKSDVTHPNILNNIISIEPYIRQFEATCIRSAIRRDVSTTFGSL